ncbi:LPO_1073/Vpar_1526 family protein [Pelagibacterium flavum]|uniref:LPO_1073/Vpar_1526 family protein n=1 Tax=Pelagibacterium flavum TaxID=2984530 RepID=UPI00299F70EC|nr:LPO_1073/Vpar_1526 family protein [Pelagibacterium sp. YIM 151497]
MVGLFRKAREKLSIKRLEKEELASKPEETSISKTNDQAQQAGPGAVAIQANGSVNFGISKQDMAEILAEVVQLQVRYQAEAERKVEDRLSEIREDLLLTFADEKKANSEAFRDPDFQYMLGETQAAYARSGNQTVKNTLVDIIARRSKAAPQSREALTLNEASLVAPRLSEADYAVLSLCYMLRYTVHTGIQTPHELQQYLRTMVMPHVGIATSSQSTFWFLEAQRCGTLQIDQLELRKSFVRKYPTTVALGAKEEEFLKLVDETKQDIVRSLLRPSRRDRTLRQPRNASKDEFLDHAKRAGLNDQEAANIWACYVATIPSGDDFVAMLEQDVPGIGRLFELWENSPMKQFALNATGIAIGHANAVQATGLDAELSVWIN